MNTLSFIKTHARYLLFGFLHFFSSAVGQTYFIGLFVAGVTQAMGWGDDTFATIYSSITLAAAFTLPVIGVQLDRYSVRYVSTAVAVLLAVAFVGLSQANNVFTFGLALYLIRLGGQGVLPLIGSTTIGRYFEEGRGKALALTNVGKSVAEVIIPPAVVALLALYSYQTIWLGAATWLVLLFLPAVWLLVRRSDSFQRADRVLAQQAGVAAQEVQSFTRGQAFADRRLQLILPAYIFAPFVITGIIFNQSLLAESRGLTLAWMALGVSSYGVARSLCVLLAGPVVDRFGPERVLLVIHLPMLLGLFVLMLFTAKWSVPAFFVLCGIGMGAESVLWPALWAERYGPAHLGSIKSAIRVFMVIGTALSPLLCAWGFARTPSLTLAGILGYGVLAISLVWLSAWQSK